MIRLLTIESFKLLKKSRTYLSFLLLSLLIFILYFGLALEGESLVDFILSGFIEQFSIEGKIMNGYFVSFLILGSLFVHIPILITIVTGDLLSSELEDGTARLYLARNIARWKWLMAKHLVALAFVLVYTLFTAFLILIPGIIIFGKGDIIVLFRGFEIILEGEFLYRYFLAIVYSAFGLSVFGIFTVALSVFVKRSLPTILITLGILIISTLLQNFAPGVFEAWNPYLFTYHMSQWQLFFFTEIPYDEILFSIFWLVGFAGISIIVSIIKFNKMNILE